MKEVKHSAESLAQIAKHANSLGFSQHKTKPHVFIIQNEANRFMVDLSASGTSFEAVAKNIVAQMFEPLEQFLFGDDENEKNQYV